MDLTEFFLSELAVRGEVRIKGSLEDNGYYIDVEYINAKRESDWSSGYKRRST